MEEHELAGKAQLSKTSLAEEPPVMEIWVVTYGQVPVPPESQRIGAVAVAVALEGLVKTLQLMDQEMAELD